MKENNDNQEFDFEKSEITGGRSYFINEELVHKLNNPDCGSHLADHYLLEEQEKIIIELKTHTIRKRIKIKGITK